MVELAVPVTTGQIGDASQLTQVEQTVQHAKRRDSQLVLTDEANKVLQERP